jgi:hypothetical protein
MSNQNQAEEDTSYWWMDYLAERNNNCKYIGTKCLQTQFQKTNAIGQTYTHTHTHTHTHTKQNNQ